MVANREPFSLRDLLLAFLDRIVDELLDPATLLADDMVVMVTTIEFEHRLAAFEVVLLRQAGADELSQHTVDRGQADFLASLQQGLVDVFGGHMPRVARLENLEDLNPRQRDLEASLANLLVLHAHLQAMYSPPGIRYHFGGRRDTIDPQTHMRKLLIFIPLAATMAGAGCSTVGDGLRSLNSVTEVIPNALDAAPLVYRPEIQQGNIVTQEQVNQLKPGMSKRQVRFLLGSPMLTDVFHNDRWDYAYTFGKGSKPTESKRVTVYFEGDRLTRIAGDLRPQPESERTEAKKEILVTVPDWDAPATTLWGRALKTVGVGDD